MIGRYPVSPMEVILAIVSVFAPITTNLDSTIYTVVWDIRLPRIISAMIVGAALSISGAAFQGTFQNPLVSPDILGVSSGAGFGAAIAILFSFSAVMIQATAFLFGLVAVILTYSLSKKLRGNTILVMVLGGIAIAALFSALISCIKYLADPDSKLPEIVYWLMGSLSAVNSNSVLMIIGPALIGFTALLLIGWRINVLSMGDDEARSMGVNTEKNEAAGNFLLYVLNSLRCKHKWYHRLGGPCNTSRSQDDRRPGSQKAFACKHFTGGYFPSAG